MPILELPALFVSPTRAHITRSSGPAGARVRFGNEKAQRLKRCRRARRTSLEVDVLTVGGTHRATLASITLYGGSLDGAHRLRRREMLALRLPNGGRVQARVRWRLGRRSGIQFLSPVADFARLLRESRLAQGERGPTRSFGAAPQLASRASNPVVRLHGALTRAQRLSRRVLRWCRSL